MKDNLKILEGKYLNGFRIQKVEYDPFIKGQINLFTDEFYDIGFGDKASIKFVVTENQLSSTIFQEQTNKYKVLCKDLLYELKKNPRLMNNPILFDFTLKLGKLEGEEYGND